MGALTDITVRAWILRGLVAEMVEWIPVDDDRVGKDCYARSSSPGQHGGKGKIYGVFRIKGGKRRMIQVYLYNWGSHWYPEKYVRMLKKKKIRRRKKNA